MPVEVMSAFARAERSGDITTQNRSVAEKLFETIENKFTTLHLEQRVVEIARILPVRYGLTALDSLQLASALVWCKEFPNGKDFVSADKRLLMAAENVGFTIHDLQ
jgi:predicted nucleic acid-binding protein